MRTITKAAALAAATVFMTATAANAYTMDAAGYGFVGKGEVQTPFGWNNATLQQYASTVTFTYDTSATYEAICTFTTGEGTKGEKTHNIEHNESAIVAASLNGDPRQTKGQRQFTGFILSGFGQTTTTGEVPVTGEACPGNEGHDGTWSSVEQTGMTEGGLWAHHRDTNKHTLLVEDVLVIG